ncbi:MAG: FliM/FliN family flagellar motor switch protein [Firmicutes bacterium]|nr:FliM/FliN family flagellar motor switch protein [Bacillota bacterium]
MAEQNTGPLSQEEIDALLAGMSPGVSGELEDGSMATKDSAATGELMEQLSSPVHEPVPITDPRLRRVADLPVNMTVSLGETVLSLETVLQLGIGSRIVFDKKWHDHATIKLNGLPIGNGRIVLVANTFGVEVTAWGNS